MKSIVMRFSFVNLIIAFLLLSSGSSAQSYQPLPTQSVQWNCFFSQYSYGGPGTFSTDTDEMTYIAGGDTLFGINSYTILFRSRFNVLNQTYSGNQYVLSNWYPMEYFGCLRNDSINKKVFYIPPDSTNEKLLYDFSLQPGDTINNWWNYRIDLITPFPILVEAIDSVFIHGQFRRRLHITESGAGPVALIEGIGSTAGLLNPLYYFESYGTLNCFKLNSQILYPDTATNCIALSSQEVDQHDEVISVFPNPSSGKIVLSNVAPNSLLFVYDVVGRLVWSERILTEDILVDLSGNEKGIYLCRLVESDGKSTVRKIVLGN